MVQVSRFEEQTLRLEKKLEIEKDGNRQEKEWNEQMWEVKAIEINLNVRCQQLIRCLVFFSTLFWSHKPIYLLPC